MQAYYLKNIENSNELRVLSCECHVLTQFDKKSQSSQREINVFLPMCR